VLGLAISRRDIPSDSEQKEKAAGLPASFFVAKATVSLGRPDDLSHTSSLPSDWQRAASTARASWHLEVQSSRRFTYLSFS
jgi:hypothetical protein